MKRVDFQKALDEILKHDSRYEPDAYEPPIGATAISESVECAEGFVAKQNLGARRLVRVVAILKRLTGRSSPLLSRGRKREILWQKFKRTTNSATAKTRCSLSCS